MRRLAFTFFVAAWLGGFMWAVALFASRTMTCERETRVAIASMQIGGCQR